MKTDEDISKIVNPTTPNSLEQSVAGTRVSEPLKCSICQKAMKSRRLVKCHSKTVHLVAGITSKFKVNVKPGQIT